MNFKQWLISEEEEKDINLSNPNLTSTIPPLNTSVSNPSLTTTKISSREIASNKKVEALAIEYINAKGFAELPIKFKNFLNDKRRAYQDYKTNKKTTTSTWYPSDIEVAEKNGLPNNWMLFFDLETESNKKVEALGKRYQELGEQYPPEFRSFLQMKRRAYQDYKTNKKTTTNIWYPSDIEVAEKNGLPNNWMDYQIETIKSRNEQKSNDRLEELAIYYGKNGSGPSAHASDKKEKSLGQWLNSKKKRNNQHEESDKVTWAKIVELSKNWDKQAFPHELPKDWRIIEPAGEKSLGEKLVANILKELEIKNEPEYRDDACFNQRCLPFDFSITHNGKKYFLEYNGGQHYYPAYFGSGEGMTDQEKAKHAIDKFEYTKENDTKKYQHCVKENIPFLVIPYWLYKTPDIIESTIIEFLKTNEFNETFANPVVPQKNKEYHDRKLKITECFADGKLDCKELFKKQKITFEQFLINKIL